MCQSPNCSLVRRTIDLNYANKQRAVSLKWLLINGALLAVLVYDLRSGCGECLSAAAWAEALGACVLAANCVQHACRLAGAGRRGHAAAPACPLSPRQQLLLGLKDCDLDSSFLVTDGCTAPRPQPARAPPCQEEPGSLSPARSWRAADSPPPSPPSPGSPGTGAERASPDLFISDGRALAAYIRQQEVRVVPGAGGEAAGRVLPAAPAHQLAVLPERGTKEPGGGEEGGAGGAGGSPLWRRLHVDPQRLTEYNLNLRLWLQVTVVGRVARELAAVETAGVSLAAVGTAGAGARADALLPFLRPFADRQYVADRIKDLSHGGCLSAFRWDGGGRGWSVARPPDAELLLHLLATYLDLVVPGGDFSARHVSEAPAPPARPLALHRVARSPPHYALVLGDETIELPRGRNNLLHTLLLFIAAAARGAPPALCRLHLGAAGLNMLWILGQ